MQEAASHGREWAEREHTPSVVLPADARLRSWVAGDYGGFGVAPHMAARLLRLSTVWRHLDHQQTWARIAAESGYADQAHLIREFRHFTRTTPTALITA